VKILAYSGWTSWRHFVALHPGLQSIPARFCLTFQCQSSIHCRFQICTFDCWTLTESNPFEGTRLFVGIESADRLISLHFSKWMLIQANSCLYATDLSYFDSKAPYSNSLSGVDMNCIAGERSFPFTFRSEGSHHQINVHIWLIEAILIQHIHIFFIFVSHSSGAVRIRVIVSQAIFHQTFRSEWE
jgi:hypothetical protein